jgi:hypothetical protein
MSNVIPFRQWPAELTPSQRRAVRRIYREGVKEIAARVIPEAFTEACKLPGTKGMGCEDAFPVFVAAMRRELRKSGLF